MDSAPPLVTLHVWRVPRRSVGAAFLRMAGDPRRLRQLPGARFGKLLGTGTGLSFGPGDADLTRYAAVMSWDTDDGGDLGAVGAAWDRLALSSARVDLTPIMSHGRWSGQMPFGEGARRKISTDHKAEAGNSTGRKAEPSNSTGRKAEPSNSTGRKAKAGDSTGRKAKAGNSTDQEAGTGNSTSRKAETDNSPGQEAGTGNSASWEAKAGQNTSREAGAGQNTGREARTGSAGPDENALREASAGSAETGEPGAGRREPGESPSSGRTGGMVLALTRARLRPAKALTFWKAVPPVARALAGAPGLLARFGVGEAPVGWQGTVSVWRSAADLTTFAYRQPEHRAVIAATPAIRWYAEDLFARFAVRDISGDKAVLGWREGER
jgi:hypothetical protein